MRPLRIVYLLEDTSLTGGARVVIAHGDLLSARGHSVLIATKGEQPRWRSTASGWRSVNRFDELDGMHFDFVVGTFWTTLSATYELAGAVRGVHLCQGYEGSFTAYRAIKPLIDAAYAIPLPKITVSPHLVELCSSFNEDVECIGQVVDPEFFQKPSKGSRARPRVLLVGPAQVDFKGIDIGYKAVQHARELGAEFDLVRVSQIPPEPDEPVGLASEFHVGLDTGAIAKVMRDVDVFLGPSREAEGFGLPAAEAMASGVPALLTRISSFLSWSDAQDHAVFVDENDWQAMGEALWKLLEDSAARDWLAARGQETVAQFRGDYVGERLEDYFMRRQTSLSG